MPLSLIGLTRNFFDIYYPVAFYFNVKPFVLIVKQDSYKLLQVSQAEQTGLRLTGVTFKHQD